jgi:hypothetical protein
MTVRSDVLDVIKSFPFYEVELGYQTVTLFTSEQLDERQFGHSVSADGEGDSNHSLVVIGRDELLGDPIFIDTAQADFPVYIWMHDVDGEPEKIAASLASFVSALGYIKKLSVGRENPVALETNPIPPVEREQILSQISKENPGIDMGFWENWLQDY